MYHNKIEITFHTRDAEILYQGGDYRAQQFIPSFRYTRKRINDLYVMACAENPYAEAALIDLDYRLEDIEGKVLDCITISRRCIKAAEKKGVKTRLLTNSTLYVHQIEYITEYTVFMAKMMTRIDEGFRFLRTAHYTGELDTKPAKAMIRLLRTLVRGFNEQTIRYAKRITPGITRKDIQNKTAKAMTMRDKLGTPSAAILNRTLTHKGQRITELDLF